MQQHSFQFTFSSTALTIFVSLSIPGPLPKSKVRKGFLSSAEWGTEERVDFWAL